MISFHDIKRFFNRRRHSLVSAACVAIVSLPALLAQQPRSNSVTPVIPSADRNQPGKVFLEHADRLSQEEGPDNHPRDYQVLAGNVVFRKDAMFMYCDSAYFYEKTNSLDAFSNVRMQQGDTLFVYADELNYNGMTEIAHLYSGHGTQVRMVNRDVTLTTDQFQYDLKRNVGFYEFGGRLFDKQNTLTSIQGYYYPRTKDAYFIDNVKLESRNKRDTLWMFTDSLRYNTRTHISNILCPTRIINADGEINTTSGNYNTATGRAFLFSRSSIVTRKGNTLTGDTLFYDRKFGYGEARGNMILNDTVNKSILYGDYGYFNEVTDSAFVTGEALAKDYSRDDTLYLHGDTINAYRLPDTTRVTNAFRHVRFYRSDLQGICDSMSVTEKDSLLRMFHKPIVWSGERQISGNLISVHFNDSTVDWARLPNGGVMSEHIGEDCYNQLSGKDMTAWLNDTTITRLYVEGNVQIIMFPMENDSTYNKFAFVESSFMDAKFENNNIDRILLWPETTGSVTPLYLARRSSYFLPGFRWLGNFRPLSPDEVFDNPPGMEEYLSSDDGPMQRRMSSGQVSTTPMAPKAPAETFTSTDKSLKNITIPDNNNGKDNP